MPGHFLDDLRASFADYSGRTAIVYRGRDYAYGEIETRARRCAALMQRLGLSAGDRVAIVTSDKLPFLSAHLGALFSGAIAMPINPMSTADELRTMLQDSGARVVVAGRVEWPIVASLKPVLPELRALIADREAWDAPEGTINDPDPGRDEPCLLLYRRTANGQPMGVVHTHASLSASLRALGDCWRFTSEDVLINALPLFEIYGLSIAAHLCLLNGGALHVEDRFHPRETLEAIVRGSVFMGVPTFYQSFLERRDFREISRRWERVRLFTCGMGSMRPNVLAGVEAILERPLIRFFGSTEGHVITSLPLDGPWPRGSVGSAVEGMALQVVDDEGTPLSTGRVGSIQVRGPNLFQHYWRQPDATRAAFASGWFDTDVRGMLDANGFLSLTGSTTS